MTFTLLSKLTLKDEQFSCWRMSDIKTNSFAGAFAGQWQFFDIIGTVLVTYYVIVIDMLNYGTLYQWLLIFLACFDTLGIDWVEIKGKVVGYQYGTMVITIISTKDITIAFLSVIARIDLLGRIQFKQNNWWILCRWNIVHLQ